MKSRSPLTMADAKEILKGYGDFEESPTQQQIVALSTILELLVETACGAIDGADTLAGVGTEVIAAGTCKFFHFVRKPSKGRKQHLTDI